MPRHIVCLTFDFDAMSGFIARGMTSPSALSRGEFGADVATPRLLALLARHGIPASWYIPGHTLETYPGACARIFEGGHEIGHHGWTHVAPAALSRDQEEEGLERANEQIRQLTGRRARGYRSPAWDLGWLVASVAVVPLGLLAVHAGVSSDFINIAVTLAVGGPHLFSTYLATYLDPRFRRSHRGLLVAALVTCVALFFTDLGVVHPLITVSVIVLTAVVFSLGGLLNAMFAKTFDDITIIPTFVLTPLTYLGGVFFSIALLSPFWQAVARVNPILYMVNAFRYGMLGSSDIAIGTAFAIILLSCALLFALTLYLLRRGFGIRT